MSSVIAILLIAILNLVPANVTSLALEVGSEKKIQFTKLADGSWSALESPGEKPMLLSIKGGKLTMKTEGDKNEQTEDFSKILGIDENTDWSKIKQFKTGAISIQIERVNNGLDFVLSEKKQGKILREVFKARWNKNEK
jgi:hypothetical protein